MIAEKANLTTKIEKQQKEVITLFSQIENLKNDIKTNIDKLEEQEYIKNQLATQIAAQKQLIEMTKLNVDQIELKYHKQL